MIMRAPATELPVVFLEVAILAGEVTILDDISLTLAAGAPTVLIGPNGSGKTTLLRAAMGLIPVTRGRITWGGRDGGVAAATAAPFCSSARSCSAAAPPAMSATRWPRQACRAPARKNAAPNCWRWSASTGLERRPARRLSGGEQQRLALARALARDPELLFLDEPTASLDPAATKAIEDIVRAVAARGVKVVMATHDLGEAKRLAGDIVLLHRGRLIETRSRGGIFRQPAHAGGAQVHRRGVAGVRINRLSSRASA